jgi:hypothetical protein
MNRRDLENGTEALPRVEAPANFDFGVKARIAASGSKTRSTMFSFFKVAIPLSLLLVVGGFAIFYGTRSGENVAAVPNVAVPQNTTADPAPVSNRDETARNEEGSSASGPQVEDPVGGGTEVAAEPRNGIPATRPLRRKGGTLSHDEPLRSRDSAITPAKIINPPGIPASDGGEFSVRDVLEMLGMKVDFVRGRWHVLSTAADSIAEKSGVLASDVVESINEQTIRGKDKLKGKLEAKILTVGRDGKSIKLDLKR